MGDIHRLPNPEDTEREASDWFARMNADDASADDRVRFEAWLRVHPCNVKAYDELVATWNELVKSGPLVRAVSFGQAINAASARSKRGPRWLVGTLVAAVAVIAIGVARRSRGGRAAHCRRECFGCLRRDDRASLGRG